MLPFQNMLLVDKKYFQMLYRHKLKKKEQTTEKRICHQKYYVVFSTLLDDSGLLDR